MNGFITRSAPPDGLTDEQHQEWLLAHASEHFAKIGKTDNQRKRLRLTADVSAALEDDAGGSTFLSSIFLFAPHLSLPVPLLCPLLVILCDAGRPPGRGAGGGRRGKLDVWHGIRCPACCVLTVASSHPRVRARALQDPTCWNRAAAIPPASRPRLPRPTRWSPRTQKSPSLLVTPEPTHNPPPPLPSHRAAPYSFSHRPTPPCMCTAPFYSAFKAGHTSFTHNDQHP